jgi:hypothetical protein
MNIFPFAMTPFRPSVQYMLLRTGPWLLLYFASIPAVFLIHPLLIIVNLLILMAFFYHFFLLCSELYVVTPDMLMVSTGLLNKTVSWFEPLQIKEFKMHQNRLMRYFHISHITVISEDEINMKFTLKGIDIKTLTEALQLTIDLLKVRQEYVRLLVKMVELADALKENNGK